MSISDSMTNDIYRSDGTIHPGPRMDWQGTNRDPFGVVLDEEAIK